MSTPKFERITIKTVSPDGWPVDFELVPERGATEAAIEFLEKLGYAPAPTAEAARDYQYTPDGLPICPKHGEVMSKREKQGDTWYSHSVTGPDGQKQYCRGYQSKNSPGWNY